MPKLSSRVLGHATPTLRWPSLRQPIDVLFLVACVGLTIFAVAPELFGSGKSKDYSLWFWAGQQVLSGGDLYPHSATESFPFLYPPLPAILLALPTLLGKVPFYVTLCVLNSVAWWITGQLANALTGAPKIPGPWLAALPGFATLTFVYDMYDLGQPNLVLLAMMLGGFWYLQRGRNWLAGSLFALAAAIKVFPIAVLPYLIWRRHWQATFATLVMSVVLLVLVPAPIRGFDRNIGELKTWYAGMVGTSSEKGFGQRDEQNWSWINQSIVAITHRLVRPVNYNQDRPTRSPAYMNFADVDFKTANAIVVVVSALLGLWFIWVMPRASRRTERSDAEEIGILFCLITIASPLARQYYFLWLFFPMTVLMHRAAFDPRSVVRRGTWAALGVMGVLLLLSLPIFPLALQAYGNNLIATFVVMATLAWHIRHPSMSSDPT